MTALIGLNINELPWSLGDGPDGGAGGLFENTSQSNSSPFSIDLSQLSLNRYPDPDYTSLRTLLAETYELDANQVTLANGSDELIWLSLSVLLQAGDTLVTHAPTFGEYERMATLRGAKTVYAPIEKNLSTVLPNVLTIARRCGAKLVVICRPNNPTGELLPLPELRAFLDAYEGYVLLDEAYIEFSGEVPLPSDLLLAYPNLIILRTFSKAYGLAGIRLGYSFASKAITAQFNSQRPPYNINAITAYIGEKALKEKPYFEARIAAIIKERERIQEKLTTLDISFIPSFANFILLTSLSNGAALSGTNAAQLLKRKGFVVRAFTEDWLSHCIRFSIGTPAQNDAFLEVLQTL
jgi:histidinol-phosphate aminotransferase